MWSEASDFVELDYRGQHVPVSFRSFGEDAYAATVDGEPVDFRLTRLGDDAFLVEADSRKRRVHLVSGEHDVALFGDGESWHFGLIDPLVGEDEVTGGGDRIVAPMPGLVKLLHAVPGTAVARGETLVVMEAMKMELTLAAPRDGTIAEVLVSQGEQVIEGAVLLAMAPEDGEREDGEAEDG